MSKRKFLVISVGIFLLLVGIIVLPSLIRNSLLPDKTENNTYLIIDNKGNTSHEVTAKLFDSKNTSILNESYILDPGEKIENYYPVGVVAGTYIEVTLDNNITETLVVPGNLSDLAILHIEINAYPDDLLDLSIAVP
ncbi:MAG TPA: hypothetical protein HA306_03845 [Methanosarcina sp.]|nr:hypothetical protein [Methanosarcina sp.]